MLPPRQNPLGETFLGVLGGTTTKMQPPGEGGQVPGLSLWMLGCEVLLMVLCFVQCVVLGDCEPPRELLGGVFERSKFSAMIRSNSDIPPLRQLCFFVWKSSVSKVHGGCLPGTSPCK